MAFQIVDDILDIQSTTEQLGKPVGGDLRQGTVTLPVMLFLETADEESRELVRRAIEGGKHNEGTIREVLSRINSSDAIPGANEVALKFVREAKDALSGLPDVPARASLLDLADFAVQRGY